MSDKRSSHLWDNIKTRHACEINQRHEVTTQNTNSVGKKTKTQSTTQNTTLVGNRNKNGGSDKGIRIHKLGNAQQKSEGYTGGEITGDIW